MPTNRIICDAEDTELLSRIKALAAKLRVPYKDIVESVLDRSTDDELARHVRLWRVRRTTLEDA